MTIAIIITFCSLLLIAYLFDLTSGKTKIPSVILLLLLGWGVRQITIFFNINLPDFTTVLPVFGTIGLILIVLEGALELNLNERTRELLKKSLVGAFIPLVILTASLAYLFHYFSGLPFKNCLISAIPFCVISSAIAIPSVRGQAVEVKEFIIYESSLSDIMGVLFFNFLVFNDSFEIGSFAYFGMEVLIVLLLSLVATIGLSFLLSKIDHHVKFVPIILLTILIYSLAYSYHLPALIFILLFGLSLGNVDLLKAFPWFEQFKPEVLSKEVHKFKELTMEAAFLVRALFFLLFGYLLETSEIINLNTLALAGGIVVTIFAVRLLQLKLSKLPLLPLLFIAPRGLITILLFLSIPVQLQVSMVNRSLIIQVIVLTALVMLFGLMISGKNKPEAKKESSVTPNEEHSEVPKIL